MVTDKRVHSNPDNVWSYGWSTNATGTFQLLTNDTFFPGTGQELYTNNFTQPHLVLCRLDFSTNIFSVGTPFVMPDTICLDPQLNACMVRFTAPASGYFAIQGFFRLQDSGTTAHNLMVLINSSKTNYFLNSNNGTNFQEYQFKSTAILNAGDTVDFVNACDSTFNSLSTGIAGTVTLLPPVRLLALGGYQISWNSVSNIDYQIQFSTNILQNSWINVGSLVTATDTNTSVFVFPNKPQNYYRIFY